MKGILGYTEHQVCVTCPSKCVWSLNRFTNILVERVFMSPLAGCLHRLQRWHPLFHFWCWRWYCSQWQLCQAGVMVRLSGCVSLISSSFFKPLNQTNSFFLSSSSYPGMTMSLDTVTVFVTLCLTWPPRNKPASWSLHYATSPTSSWIQSYTCAVRHCVICGSAWFPSDGRPPIRRLRKDPTESNKKKNQIGDQ